MGNARLNNEEALLQMLLADTFRISPDEWAKAKDEDTDETTKSKVLESIKKKCAERAYRDYNRTLEFKNQKADHSTYRNAITDETLSQIDSLLDKAKRESTNLDFDGWHKNACADVMDAANDEKFLGVIKDGVSFSYGQAQKQLNMTIKYMWLLGLWPVLNSEPITKKLHAVVDNIIIEAAWDEYKDIVLPLTKGRIKSREEYFKGCLNKYPYTSDKLTTAEGKSYPWSKWNENTYIKFQDSLKEYVESPACEYNSVFEWELDAWLRIATRSKN